MWAGFTARCSVNCTRCQAAKAKVQDLLSCTHPDPADERQDKLYALHASEVECISKGKPGHPMSSA